MKGIVHKSFRLTQIEQQEVVNAPIEISERRAWLLTPILPYQTHLKPSRKSLLKGYEKP